MAAKEYLYYGAHNQPFNIDLLPVYILMNGFVNLMGDVLLDMS